MENKIKEIIEGKKYFTRNRYFIDCAILNQKRESLDEKRQQYEDDIYELEKILEILNLNKDEKQKVFKEQNIDKEVKNGIQR